jgi:deoxyhypusine synthase
VTWGKVDKRVYRKTTESLQCDYSIVMPFLVKALLEKRARLQRWAERMGERALFAKHPAARGYLRPSEGYRLFERREELIDKLLARVKKESARLRRESRYPLASPPFRNGTRAVRRKARAAKR